MFKIFFQLLSLVGALVLTSCSEDKPTILQLKNYTINVNGKSAEIYRIEQPNGTWGYSGTQGQKFNVIVENHLSEPSSIHWHGLILPNNQDGVPFVTQAPIDSNQQYKYNFELKQKGTYWMHSHYAMQTQKGLSAPLIIHDPKNNNDYQEVIMFITDFSFKEPEEIWKELREGMTNSSHNMQGNNMGNMKMDMPEMDHSSMQNMDMITNDLNDVAYDAYLVNYKATNNQDVIKVDPKKRVLLRIINAASASNFIINLGGLEGELIAVDGEDIIPFSDSKFDLAMAQRIDVLLEVPANDEAYPILAQGEGIKMQAGLILKTDNTKNNISLTDIAAESAPALGYLQELKLQAKNPLPLKKIDRSLTVNLEGNMNDYVWKLNGEEWPNVTPLKVKEGERVEMIFNNKTMMPHPMHLHGHVFQVTEIDGKKVNGAMRDTVNILPNSIVKVQFDANNPGVWMVHCHVLYHEMGGMMTTLNYEGFEVPKFKESSFCKQ